MKSFTCARRLWRLCDFSDNENAKLFTLHVSAIRKKLHDRYPDLKSKPFRVLDYASCRRSALLLLGEQRHARLRLIRVIVLVLVLLSEQRHRLLVVVVRFRRPPALSRQERHRYRSRGRRWRRTRQPSLRFVARTRQTQRHVQLAPSSPHSVWTDVTGTQRPLLRVTVAARHAQDWSLVLLLLLLLTRQDGGGGGAVRGNGVSVRQVRKLLYLVQQFPQLERE